MTSLDYNDPRTEEEKALKSTSDKLTVGWCSKKKLKFLLEKNVEFCGECKDCYLSPASAEEVTITNLVKQLSLLKKKQEEQDKKIALLEEGIKDYIDSMIGLQNCLAEEHGIETRP